MVLQHPLYSLLIDVSFGHRLCWNMKGKWAEYVCLICSCSMAVYSSTPADWSLSSNLVAELSLPWSINRTNSCEVVGSVWLDPNNFRWIVQLSRRSLSNSPLSHSLIRSLIDLLCVDALLFLEGFCRSKLGSTITTVKEISLKFVLKLFHPEWWPGGRENKLFLQNFIAS